MIGVGDEVVCIKPAAVDDQCRPFITPRVGEVYTITSIYRMFYGLGCTLEGLDPRPYKGYVLRVDNNEKLSDAPLGWYFEKLTKLDIKKLATAPNELEDA